MIKDFGSEIKPGSLKGSSIKVKRLGLYYNNWSGCNKENEFIVACATGMKRIKSVMYMHSGGDREFLCHFSWSDYSLGYIGFFLFTFLSISFNLALLATYAVQCKYIALYIYMAGITVKLNFIWHYDTYFRHWTSIITRMWFGVQRIWKKEKIMNYFNNCNLVYGFNNGTSSEEQTSWSL